MVPENGWVALQAKLTRKAWNSPGSRNGSLYGTGALFPLAALLLAAVTLMAQSSTTGALAGTVADGKGAPLANAAVTLVHHATNQAQHASTNASGRYAFALLQPGAYAVEFSLEGFKTAAASVTVNVSEAPALDARLQPGAASERVACECRLTESASSTGTLVDQKTITAVPLTTRNLTQVLSMASGSAAEVNNAGSLGRGNSSVNVNGNTSAGSYTLDGSWPPSAVPNPDTISEFKIQNSQYDAGYGAQVPNTNLVTKRGENEVHGDFWEFVRNDVFNANAFFRNSTGQPKPNLKQNQFGATAGAPLRRNKAFVFGSYQGTRQVNGLDPTSISNPILPPLTADRSAAALAAQFCPANHLLASGQPDPRFLTFAGGRQLDCRNQSTAATAPLNPVALRLLQVKKPDGSYLIPVPQTILASGGNAGLGFSSYSLPSTYKENQFLVNVDYLVSPRNTLSGRSYAATIDQFRTFASPNGYPGAPIVPGPGTPQALDGRDYVASVKLTTVVSQNVVNEARMGFTRALSLATGADTPLAASIGMAASSPLWAQPPEITVLGPLGSFRVFGNVNNDFTSRTDTWSWSDSVSWVRGKHTLRAGAFALSQRLEREDTGAARGKISFQTFSDFLVGLSAADNLSLAGRSNVQSVQASLGVGPHGEVAYTYREYQGAGFVQDDYKLGRRLTLNLGLRWEYIPTLFDTTGTLGNTWPSLLLQSAVPPASGTFAGATVAANYDPKLVNPYTGKPFGAPPEGVFVRPNKSSFENGAAWDTFAPRFGFASQLTKRLTVRGGYGLFYQPIPISGSANGAPASSSPPFAQEFTNTDASNNLSSFEKPFPAATLGFVARTPTAQLSDKVAGPRFTAPRLHQWNVSGQWQISQTLSFDAGYFGSHGSDVLIAKGLNQPVLATSEKPVNCGYDGVPTHCVTTNTSANAKLRVPVLGETPTALVASVYEGASSYHSLQATLRKRASRGLTFQIAYTLSSARSTTGAYNDQNKPALDWGPSSFNRAQRVIANFDYQLPLAPHARGLAGGLLKGWSLAGIVIVQSGLPMTLTDPNGGAVYGRAGTSTVTLCPNADPGTLATSGSVQSRLGRWFNTQALCAPAALGADGATGYGNAGIGIVTGPGQLNTDFSLGKTARVGGLREDAMLGFRVEFYNALNHPQFSNPGTALGTATFGVITQSAVAPRLIQFGLKYLF